MAKDDGEKPIRVVDRRMFTPEGDPRPDFEPEEAPEPPKLPSTPPQSSREKAALGDRRPEAAEGERGAADPTGDFATVIRSLATTAYASLGLIPDPATGGRHRDTAVARQMIDWLAILEQKTRGNLTFEESDFLSRVLYELRLAFVEMTRAPAPKP